MACALHTDRVGVVLLNRASIEFAYAIIAQGKLLYERDVATRVEYEATVCPSFHDTIDDECHEVPVSCCHQDWTSRQPAIRDRSSLSEIQPFWPAASIRCRQPSTSSRAQADKDRDQARPTLERLQGDAHQPGALAQGHSF